MRLNEGVEVNWMSEDGVLMSNLDLWEGGDGILRDQNGRIVSENMKKDIQKMMDVALNGEKSWIRLL